MCNRVYLVGHKPNGHDTNSLPRFVDFLEPINAYYDRKPQARKRRAPVGFENMDDVPADSEDEDVVFYGERATVCYSPEVAPCMMRITSLDCLSDS